MRCCLISLNPCLSLISPASPSLIYLTQRPAVPHRVRAQPNLIISLMQVSKQFLQWSLEWFSVFVTIQNQSRGRAKFLSSWTWIYSSANACNSQKKKWYLKWERGWFLKAHFNTPREAGAWQEIIKLFFTWCIFNHANVSVFQSKSGFWFWMFPIIFYLQSLCG